MCCHPSLPPDSRLTLILKTLCGLSVAAIARALLTTEATINKRLYRTRSALRGVQFEIPAAEDLPDARETVHTALYLLFNEGHLSTADRPILRELCRDAMQLTQLLADDAAIATSDTLALLALMCFNAARLESRLDADGRLVPLDQQDRSRWDQTLIRRGYQCLGPLIADGRIVREPVPPRSGDRCSTLLGGVICRDGLGVDLPPVRSSDRNRGLADGRAESGRRGLVPRRP